MISYIPSSGAKVAFGSVMVSLAMAAHEKDLVHGVKVGISIQGVHYLSEFLPLGSVARPRARIRLIEKAKINGSLRGYVRQVSLPMVR